MKGSMLMVIKKDILKYLEHDEIIDDVSANALALRRKLCYLCLKDRN